MVMLVGVDPIFDDVRGESRYQSVLRRMGSILDPEIDRALLFSFSSLASLRLKAFQPQRDAGDAEEKRRRMKRGWAQGFHRAHCAYQSTLYSIPLALDRLTGIQSAPYIGTAGRPPFARITASPYCERLVPRLNSNRYSSLFNKA